MFRRFRRDKSSIYDEPIDRVLSEMNMYGPDTEEYPKMIRYLDSLVRMKGAEHPKNRVSPDTMLIVAGNLLGILVIVIYEQKHVLVSKGMGFILKVGAKGVSHS
jgi:hypothetical protein